MWGKASTFLQIFLALVIMIRNTAAGIAQPGPLEPLLWAVAALTAFSGIHYLWRGVRILTTEV